MTDETRNLIKEVAEETSRQTVSRMLTALGADVEHPREMQADFQHLREWRVAMTAIQKRALVTLVGILVAGVCAALWIGLKHFLR
jgi:hypothetical protein